MRSRVRNWSSTSRSWRSRPVRPWSSTTATSLLVAAGSTDRTASLTPLTLATTTMTESQRFFDELNDEYCAVHKAKEDLFWATYMGTSEDHAGFTRAENAFKDFVSN